MLCLFVQGLYAHTCLYKNEWPINFALKYLLNRKSLFNVNHNIIFPISRAHTQCSRHQRRYKYGVLFILYWVNEVGMVSKSFSNRKNFIIPLSEMKFIWKPIKISIAIRDILKYFTLQSHYTLKCWMVKISYDDCQKPALLEYSSGVALAETFNLGVN